MELKMILICALYDWIAAFSSHSSFQYPSSVLGGSSFYLQ